MPGSNTHGAVGTGEEFYATCLKRLPQLRCSRAVNIMAMTLVIPDRAS